jgi:hypothetical protein
MKRKVLTLISMVSILALAACGPAPTPTMNAADVANTAVAIAWTSLAMTQAALPTATATFTPLPTDTPLPTFTPIPLPTLAVNNFNASPTPSTNPCNEPMPPKTNGTKVQVKFVNKSGGIADLSFGLIEKNDLGECGIYGFRLGIFDAPVVEVLTGCYWAFAYISGQKTSTAKSVQNICLEAGEMRGVTITSEVIGFD